MNKIAFVSSLNPHNINMWSGTLYHIFCSLEKIGFSVEWIGEDVIEQKRRLHNLQCPNVKFYPELYVDYFGEVLSMQIRRGKYDLVLCRDYFFLARLAIDRPVIYVADTTTELIKHYLGVSETFLKLANYIEKEAIMRADKIVYSSRWAAESAIGFYGASLSKVEVVEFGANIPYDLSRDYVREGIMKDDYCNLLFIAKDWYGKGGDIVLNTIKKLRSDNVKCHLTIIGCSPDISSDIDVEIIPYLDKSNNEDLALLKEKYEEATLFFLPTRFDCFGIVFAEAATFALPSIACNVGGVNQVVKDGVNGILMPPNALADDYATVIKNLIYDKEKYSKLCKSAKEDAKKRLNWNIWAEKLNHIICEMIDSYKGDNTDNALVIPTYIINLKRREDRRKHILKEFDGREEFHVTLIEAFEHPIGAVGLWNSIRKIVMLAKSRDEDVIVICEDDHYFTEFYNKADLFRCICDSAMQGADLLCGGIGGFGTAVPVSLNRYWVDWFWCTQFIIVYKKIYDRILEYAFSETDTADGVLSRLANNKMVVYPFMSRQKETGYSDITKSNQDNPHLITTHFDRADFSLGIIHKVSHHFNYPYNH